MQSLRDKIYASAYFAGQVSRYHAWPTLREQNVAEHCWRVATIYCDLFGLPRAEVLYHCLHHDSGELYAGDIPFGAKNRVKGMGDMILEAERLGYERLGITLPEVTDLERKRLKICDLLEMWEFGSYEMRMGNALAEPVVSDTSALVLKMAGELGMYFIVREWMEKQV